MKQSINKKKQFRSDKKQSDSFPSLSAFLQSNKFSYYLIAVFVLLVASLRWKLTGMPLERDEGEYAYIGHLILNGIPPYTEAYNMKLPGIYYMYALVMFVFGESYQGIHTGLLLMNAGTMILLFGAFRKFFNPMTGALTAGFYGLMSITYHVLGFAAHATHFAVFYVALGLFFLSKYEEKRSRLFAFLTGAMMGMAFLMKQQAVYFVLFGGIVFVLFEALRKPIDWKPVVLRTVLFSGGVFLPYAIVLLIAIASGSFDKFWFWTVQYASQYAAGVPWSSGKALLAGSLIPIWTEFKWIWILAIAGCGIVLLPEFSVRQKILALAFCIFSALATTPGFYFRQHYFIVFLPAVALMAALAVDFMGRWISEKIKIRWLSAVLPVVAFFFSYQTITANAQFFYSPDDPVALCKLIYGINPFVESLEIARYIKSNSSDTDKVAVLGSEPQIPFYAGRRSASGHIYVYGLMENQEYNLTMQEEMISEIEEEKPLYLVFCDVVFSWLPKRDSPQRIFDWLNKYAAEHYEVVGLVDIPDRGPSSYYWGTDAQRTPANQNVVWVLKRKAE